MKKMATFLAAAAVAFCTAVGSASAYPILTLTDALTLATVSVADNGSGDINPLLGVVTYLGPVGTNWRINVTTGLSPALGVGVPQIDLNSVDSSRYAGTLRITFSDLVMGPWSGSGASALVGGTLAGGASSADFQTKINGTLVSDLNFGSGSFSGTDSFDFTPSGADLVELIATIHHGVRGTSSFDYGLTPVPEPASLMLVGGAFFLLALYSKRRGLKMM